MYLELVFNLDNKETLSSQRLFCMFERRHCFAFFYTGRRLDQEEQERHDSGNVRGDHWSAWGATVAVGTYGQRWRRGHFPRQEQSGKKHCFIYLSPPVAAFAWIGTIVDWYARFGVDNEYLFQTFDRRKSYNQTSCTSQSSRSYYPTRPWRGDEVNRSSFDYLFFDSELPHEFIYFTNGKGLFCSRRYKAPRTCPLESSSQ